MQQFDKLNELLREIEAAKPSNPDELEQFRIRFLGTKNVIKPLMGEIRNVPNEQKKDYGQLINTVKRRRKRNLRL